MRCRTPIRIVFSVFLAHSLGGCAHSGLRSEPADLYGPGANIGTLSKLGWEIGPHTTVAEIERSESFADDEEWRIFKQNIAADEELRSIRNNAGMGYARFRKRVLVDSHYLIVF